MACIWRALSRVCRMNPAFRPAPRNTDFSRQHRLCAQARSDAKYIQGAGHPLHFLFTTILQLLIRRREAGSCAEDGNFNQNYRWATTNGHEFTRMASRAGPFHHLGRAAPPRGTAHLRVYPRSSAADSDFRQLSPAQLVRPMRCGRDGRWRRAHPSWLFELRQSPSDWACPA